MSHTFLGTTFDIHGGGLDLIFPHHENEIAQSECCHGQPMVRYWMHNGLVKPAAAADKIGGRREREEAQHALHDVQAKLSRSRGAGGLAELIRRWGGECLRFFLLRTHYRSPILFSEDALAEARTALDAFYRYFQRFQRITGQDYYQLDHARRRTQGDRLSPCGELTDPVAARRSAFLDRMDDDFNTAGALSELFELVRELNRFIDQQGLEDPQQRRAEGMAALSDATRVLRELTWILGLFPNPPPADKSADAQLVEQLVQLLVQLRSEARQRRDFTLADRIRDGLAQVGITLEDRKDGTMWSRRT